MEWRGENRLNIVFVSSNRGKSKSKNGRKDAEEIVMVSALKGMEGLFSKDK